jgi:hypothetical protein
MSRLGRLLGKFASTGATAQAQQEQAEPEHDHDLPYEDQISVAKWHATVFGELASDICVLICAIGEMSGLLRTLAENDVTPEATEKAADVMIVLYRLAHRMGFSMRTEAETAPYMPIEGDTYLAFAAASNVYLAQALVRMTQHKHPEYTIELIALAARTLERMVADRGGNLDEAVDAKMRINRQRVAKEAGHGASS